MTKPDVPVLEAIRKRLLSINACDPECQGRCRECPNDVISATLAFLSATAEDVRREDFIDWLLSFGDGDGAWTLADATRHTHALLSQFNITRKPPAAQKE